MLRLYRLPFLAIASASLCFSDASVACVIEPPPPPPARTDQESEADYAARSRAWYISLAERDRKAREPEAVRYENELWARAERIALARVEKVSTTRVRGGEGQLYGSPKVTLRPLKWLKGHSAAKRVKVHYLSDDSCAFGGAGDAPNGRVGDLFVLFYGPGPITARNLLDSFDEERAVTQRIDNAFVLGPTPK